MFGRKNECEEKFNKLAVKMGMSSWEDLYDKIEKENEEKESGTLKAELSRSSEEIKTDNDVSKETNSNSNIIAMLDEIDETIEKCLKEVKEINALNS